MTRLTGGPIKRNPLYYENIIPISRKDYTTKIWSYTVLKKLVVSLKNVQLFGLQLGRRKEEERLRCVGGFAKGGWKLYVRGTCCGFWETSCG